MIKKYVVVGMISIGLLIPQLEMNYSYEMKYGNGKEVTTQDTLDYLYFENLLDLNTYYGDNLYFYSQFEYSKPPVFGYNRTTFDSTLNKFFIEYANEKLILTFGDIYQIYGRGLGFFTMQDQNVDYDNSIKGIDIKYFFNEQFEFSFLAGRGHYGYRSNPVNLINDRSFKQSLLLSSLIYNNSSIGPIEYLYIKKYAYLKSDLIKTLYNTDSNTEIGQELIINNLDVLLNNTFQADTVLSNLHNLNWNLLFGPLDIYIDKSWITYDKIYSNRVFGSRFYASVYTELFGTGITYEYKNYYTPYLLKSISNPPVVYRESNSILASRNSHSINFGNEIGHQIDFNKSMGPINVLGNLSLAYRHANSIMKTKNIIDFIVMEEDESNYDYYPYRQIYMEVNGWTLNDKLYYKLCLDHFTEFSIRSSGKNISAFTIPTQWVYKLSSGNSLTAYIESQVQIESTKSENKELNNKYISLSYNYKGKWIWTYFFEIEEKKSLSNYWDGVDLTCKISSGILVSLFYGSQKGGLVCANGICAQQPGFEDGIKITIRSIF